MKIHLVRPNHHSHLIQPPLALGYIGAYLQRERHAVRIIDGLRDRLDNEILAARCEGAELVGVTILSDYYPQARDLVRRLKRHGAKVALGGPHVTIVPSESLEQTGADFAVVGEGEAALAELASQLEGGGDGERIPGVVTRAHPEGTARELLKDLDSLPFPDWDQLPPSSYPMAPHGGVAKNYPIVPITSSRGCPYRCSFCSSPSLWRYKIRFRSPENVVDEIEYMVRRYGVREVHFEDDNMTLKRDRAAAIAEGIIRRGLKISWATPNGIRADKVDRELVQLMKRSGLYSVAFGIESANPEILRRCGKKASIKKYENAINLTSEAGILTQGFFIFGLPGETEQTINNTIRWATNSKLDKAQFLILDVMPGTRIWDDLDHKPDLTKYQSYHDMTYVPEGLDPEILRRAPSRAFRTFFFTRPWRVLKMVSMMRPQQIKYILRRLSDFRIIPSRQFGSSESDLP